MNKAGIAISVAGIILMAGSGIVYYYSAESCNNNLYYRGEFASCIANYLPAVGIIAVTGLVALVIGAVFALRK